MNDNSPSPSSSEQSESPPCLIAGCDIMKLPRPPAPDESSERRLKGWKLFGLKIAAAFFVLLITVVVGGIAGIYSLRQPYSWISYPQGNTVRMQMRYLAEWLDEYKTKHGSFPLTIDEKLDGWMRPLIYKSDGKTWELISYGADGKPGGIGIDTDLYSSNAAEPRFSYEIYPEAVPTVMQIVRSKHFSSSLCLSAVFGTIFFFIAIRELFWRISPEAANWIELITATLGVVVAAAIFVIFHISIQSVASGH